MVSIPLPAQPLVDPVEGVQSAVQGRRWVWPLLCLMAAASLSPVAVYARYDASSRVIGELQEKGELATLTEQELHDKITTAERIFLVGGVAKGIFWSPLSMLLLAVALKITGWLLGRKTPFVSALTAASVAMLPLALYHLVKAVVASYQVVITDAQLDALVPSSAAQLFAATSPKVVRVLSTLDFFNLWSAALLGLGFAAAAGMPRPRAAGVGLLLYALYAAAFMVGLPGMTGGGA